MIRPIDTQILYPQSPELSNRQQVDKQKPDIQQNTFAQLMKNETNQKKKTVIETEKNDKIQKDKAHSDSQNKKKNNQKQEDKEHTENKVENNTKGQTHIDIRI